MAHQNNKTFFQLPTSETNYEETTSIASQLSDSQNSAPTTPDLSTGSSTGENSVDITQQSESTQSPTNTASAAPSAPAKTTRSRKKTGSEGKRSAKTEKDRAYVCVTFSVEERKKLKTTCINIDSSMTELLHNCSLNYIRNTYLCNNPSCNCRITVTPPDGETNAPAPTMCPICGGTLVHERM